MSKKSLDLVEFEQSLNNIEALDDLEFLRDHIIDERNQLIDEINQLKLKLKKLESEQKDEAMALVKEDGSALEYVGNKFQNDYDVVLEAVKKFEWALCYASSELQDDYEIVYQALKVNPNQIEYASDTLKAHDDFIKMYVDYWVGEYKIYKNIEEFLEIHELPVDEMLIRKNYDLIQD
jgi:hypothetical protein